MASEASLMSQLTFIAQMLNRYVLSSFSIISIIGNILNAIVFSQRKLRVSPCAIYLLFASYVNLIWTIAAILPRSLSTYYLDFSAQISSLCKIRHFIFFTSSSLSVWMMALATFDRFLISSPSVSYRNFSSCKNAYRLIGITASLLCINYSNLFYCANIKGTPPESSCTSITTRICGFYNELSRVMTAAIIPGIVICIFGMGTVQHLKQIRVAASITILEHDRRQCRLRKNDRQLTQMLIGQMAMILISWIPHAVQRLYVVITFDNIKSPLRSKQDSLWEQITWIVTTLNCTFSFYVYLFTGGILFRQTLRSIFRFVTPLVRNATVNPTNHA